MAHRTWAECGWCSVTLRTWNRSPVQSRPRGLAEPRPSTVCSRSGAACRPADSVMSVSRAVPRYSPRRADATAVAAAAAATVAAAPSTGCAETTTCCIRNHTPAISNILRRLRVSIKNNLCQVSGHVQSNFFRNETRFLLRCCGHARRNGSLCSRSRR